VRDDALVLFKILHSSFYFVSFRFKITFAVKTDDAHLKALLVAYFKRFGSKPVCYYDIGR
jgi:hypothetical protein